MGAQRRNSGENVRKLVAVVTAAGLVLAGTVLAPAARAVPSGTAAAEQTDYTPPPIIWGQCSDPRLVRRGADCGLLEVPMDYAHPSGTKIKLMVSRLRHKVPDAQYQGLMLINPGGPGVSGTIMAAFQEKVPNG